MSRLILALLLVAPLVGAPALATQDATVGELARTIAKQKDGVDPEIFDQLAGIGGGGSFRALQKALRSIKDEELRRTAYAAFRLYAEDPEFGPAALAYLDDEAHKANKEASRLAAVRALLTFDVAALELLEAIAAGHRDRECRQLATDALVPLFAQRGDPESLATILQNASLVHELGLPYVGLSDRDRASLAGKTHRDVVRELLGSRTDPASLELLAARLAARDASRVWKLLLLRVLSEDDSRVSSRALGEACGDRDPGVALLAVDFLIRRTEYDGREAALRPLLSSREPSLRRAAVLGLSQVLLTDEGFRAELLQLAQSSDTALRMGAAGGLALVRTPEAVDALHVLLADRDWSVRAEVLQRLTQVKSKKSIPLLIERLGLETGRLERDVHGVLAFLTGMDLGRNPENWQHWWGRERATFELPDDAARLRAEERRRKAARVGGTVAHSFYKLEVHSKRGVFVLDVSGSMRNLSTSTKGTVEVTRMQVAKEQLTEVLRKLPDGDLFNVIFFESEIRPLNKKLIEMKKSTRAKALRFVRDQYSLGATALYPAIQLAFEDPLVDTIYLLSDGAPTVGELTDIEEIRAEVARWNSARHVKIHGIAMGQDSTLLRWLCEDTGGEYKRVD